MAVPTEHQENGQGDSKPGGSSQWFLGTCHRHLCVFCFLWFPGAYFHAWHTASLQELLSEQTSVCTNE